MIGCRLQDILDEHAGYLCVSRSASPQGPCACIEARRAPARREQLMVPTRRLDAGLRRHDNNAVMPAQSLARTRYGTGIQKPDAP